MLGFLRNNSAKIVWGIIITFIVTTFLGVIFFNDSFQASRNVQQQRMDRDSAVALIGELPVTKTVYQLAFNRILRSLSDDLAMTNQRQELLQLNALNRAVEDTLLLQLEDFSKIRVTKNEIDAFLLPYFESYGVGSKGELKTALAERGESYSQLLSVINQDIKIQKIRMAIQQTVTVNDEDMANRSKMFLMKAIIVSSFPSPNVTLDDEALYAKASAIRDAIHDEASFDQQLSLVSPNDTHDYQWVPMTGFTPDMARSVAGLSPNEVSQPIKFINGFAIVSLSDVKDAVTPSITVDQLKSEWTKNTLTSVVVHAQRGRAVKILNPQLKALTFKAQGRFDEAIMAYRGLMSNDPSNPYPNLYIAELQLMMGDVSSAKQSLLKAEIKESLVSDSVIIPQIHLMLADIYHDQKFPAKRNQQYDRLLSADSSVELLTYLKDKFKSLNDDTRLSKATALIDEKVAQQDTPTPIKTELDNTPLPSLDF